MTPKDKKELDRLMKDFSPQAIRRRERALARRIQKEEALRSYRVNLFILCEMVGLLLFELLCEQLPKEESLRLHGEVVEALKAAAAESSDFKEAFGKLIRFVNPYRRNL